MGAKIQGWPKGGGGRKEGVLTYCNAPADLAKKVVILESVWVRVETQLQVVCRMSDQGLWNDELADCHFALL